VNAAACVRCGESLSNPAEPCGFCVHERRHEAVTTLVQVCGRWGSEVAQRADAIDTLRTLGHSKEEVLHARARAFDGHSVEDILEGLCGDEREPLAA
jgi:hypothetical protein